MKKNQLGTSDLQVSEIGFGTMSLPENDADAIRIVHEAIDRGVNFFDTADLYSQGRMESVLGKAIKGKRNSVILASKVGNHWEPGKSDWFWDPSKSYIKEAIKGSLKRLGVDYLDLYQLHGGTLDDPIDETIEAFEELKAEGLVRYYGISSIRPNVIREYVKRSNMVSVMMQYSLLDRRPEEAILDLLGEHQISVIARGPVARGHLSHKGLEKVSAKGYLDYSEDELRQTIESLQHHLKDGESLSHSALRYVLDHPTVAVAVPGASRLSQLLDNLEVADIKPLTGQERVALSQLTTANHYTNHR